VTFAAAIAAAADTQPHARPSKVAGRTLLVDGDGLAYDCAGNDDTPSGVARRNMEDKIASAMRAAGADRVMILATSRASHKGHRYAIARVKPYQGKRDSSRRPKNWAFLRELIERDPRAVVTDTLEADDLFHINSVRLGDDNVALLTEDKDMRMVPGWHLHWQTHALVRVHPETWATEAGGKVFGRKWFWLQMLHGDSTDNIPGLPQWVNEKGTRKPCGPVTAENLLADCKGEPWARSAVCKAYRDSYGEGWEAQLLEQACLLWMRRTDRLFDCTAPGGPLDCMSPALTKAVLEVRSRVEDV
jgi:hypothetical protein